MNLRKMVASWKTPGPTMVVEHGANPGLISHFTKQGLLDIAAQAGKDKKFAKAKADEIYHHMTDRAFNLLAMKLGVKVIHVSERDTQITSTPKQVGEFVNTWSIEGFREEGTTTSEMGWGTHELTLPKRAYEHKTGPKNQICLSRMGINTQVVSYVPDYTIHGMIVRHGESFTISDALTVIEGKKPVYRPTVHYAYCPCDAAVASLNELRGNDFQLQNKQRIMQDEITSGSDIMGALILGHPYKAWWTGSDLSIEEARRLVPHQNATTVQVAISVVAASIWMIENPAKGYCTPEDLPHDFILNIAKPYLGKWISQAYDWTPLKHRDNSLAQFSGVKLDRKDPWQFHNFLLTEGE
jgi:homospermidine synthase